MSRQPFLVPLQVVSLLSLTSLHNGFLLYKSLWYQCSLELIYLCCADGSSSWNAANQASMHLTPTQIAQLMPGYVQAPSKDGKSAFVLGCPLLSMSMQVRSKVCTCSASCIVDKVTSQTLFIKLAYQYGHAFANQ